MRKTPYQTWLLAGLFLLMSWVAHAAGLGKLTILSALGQPLLAEVDLVSVRAGESATLVARLAPPEAYTQANILYSPALVGVRMTIERRPDGQSYIKVISTRPVNEPFIHLLVELSWPQGRLVREYTALIDPIGYTPPTVAIAPDAPVVSPMVVTPPVTPEPQPIEPARQPPPVAAAAPVEAKPAAEKARPAKPPVAAATAAADKAYGPVKRGETLGRIASKVKPPGVTLEQMLVGLYHANPDAFAGNMNLLKTGKILRIPERESVIATGQPEAVKEVRVEAANWNAYRQKLAEAAGESPARESKSIASGKITTKVDDQAAGKAAPKEVLKLSKGEPAAGKAPRGKAARGSVPNRIRTLEEEAIAREKALGESNIRIAQLEKTIKDMQRVIEIKAQAPVAKPAPPPPPPPAPEPDLIEQIMGEPAYLAAVLALFGVGGYLVVRRRRAQARDDEPIFTKIEPEIGPETAAVEGTVLARLGGYLSAFRRRARAGDGEAERIAPELGATAATVAAVSAASAVAPAIAAPVAGSAEDIDPLAEADMYLNFGRDVQAEQVLKETLAKKPGQQEAQLKLLQIYAGRKDKASFEKIARGLYAQTQGNGDDWIKAAAMGYVLDPANALYEAGKSAPAAIPVVGVAPIGDVDFAFDLAVAPAAEAATTDSISSPATETDAALRPGEEAVTADTQSLVEPEPALHAYGEETAGAQVSAEPASHMANVIDFKFEAGPAPVAAETAQQPTDAGRGGMHMVEPDFKLDFNTGGAEAAVAEAPALKLDEISLNFDEGPDAIASPAERVARDDHWHDVQTKFDLAKAYQEMGEKDGAREILREVIKEGDAGQRADAQRLLDKLG
ncbi:MAG: FimV family protein [Betaproteobacteria bacterium]|nr:FimV family protein [Betaproteobacteria bacterium]